MTSFNESDVAAIIADQSKVIVDNIVWRLQPTITPASKFRAPISCAEDPPLLMEGFFNPMSGKLSFSMILQGQGRIYGLDLGREHRNVGDEKVGETHKVRWTVSDRDRLAFVPKDISAHWSDPVAVWQQFCLEANLRHTGRMIAPAMQGELPI